MTDSEAQVLSLRGVNMHFGGLHAIRDLTMDVEPGRITALIGPNGAGKTTIFNIVTGFLRPQTGEVFYGERSLTGARPDQVSHAGLGRSFQDLKLFRGLTCFENVLAATPAQHGATVTSAIFRRKAIAARERERAEHAMSMLEFTGLADKADTLARDLGYAEAKLLSLARVLTLDSKFLLLDEPCSGLDQGALDRVTGMLRDLVSRGVSICLIEHNMALVRDVADFGIFLEQGALVAADSIEALIADSRMRERYLGVGGDHG